MKTTRQYLFAVTRGQLHCPHSHAVWTEFYWAIDGDDAERQAEKKGNDPILHVALAPVGPNLGGEA